MNTIIDNWNAILKQLENEFDISRATLEAWQISKLELYKVENGVVYFVVPDKLKQLLNKYNEKFATPLLITIMEITNQNIDEIRFISSSDVVVEEVSEEEVVPNIPQKDPSQNSFQKTSKNKLNTKYTFDTYVVGENNRLAYTSCLAVAESPGDQFNPLFLYGGSGLGKTHLMHSIVHYIEENMPEKNILYVNTTDLVNEIISNLRNTNKDNVVMYMDNMRDKYYNLDVLLIDDIQFIIGKEHTQEEFFHIFNKLYESGKQIIISSDRPPKELKTLEDRLINRFGVGLITDISSPTYETRRAILDKKRILLKRTFQDSILDYMAKNISTNIRDLEGALMRLISYSQLYNKPCEDITIEEAIHELQCYVTPDKPVEVTAKFIIKVVAEYFNITPEEITSSNRSKNIAHARHICMYLCKKIIPKMTFKDIGKELGGKDHSTCMSGYNKILDNYMKDDTLRNTVDVLQKMIYPSSNS